MGLYNKLTRNDPLKSTNMKFNSKPLPPQAHAALLVSLLVGIISFVVFPTVLPYLRNRNVNMFATRRSKTLLSNNSYNFNTDFCNVPRVEAKDLTVPAFIGDYAGKRPVIIVDHEHNKHFPPYITKEKLKQDFGQIQVILSASNSYTKDKKTVSVNHYVNKIMAQPQTLKSLGNETFYLFGDNYGDEWNPLLDRLHISKFAGSENTLSFGVGGQGSGVPFHFHGGGFSEVFQGRKRWFLTPHDQVPPFDPDESMLQWVHNKYNKLDSKRELTHLLECTIGPGEMLYFPSQWHHGVLNLDPWTAFVSTFTLGEDVPRGIIL